ncbi:hypothetical protein [Xanthomonas campestris]|uniref:hypothetical protein n=1 Tax=Xanthomonas campestris TaxID=339 RepID=UPI0023688056|nr:hypothetical protein [Xanthomonas campestris]
MDHQLAGTRVEVGHVLHRLDHPRIAPVAGVAQYLEAIELRPRLASLQAVALQWPYDQHGTHSRFKC